MKKPLPSMATIKRRLKEACNAQVYGRAAEERIFKDVDLATLCQEDRRRLQWICEKIVWPETRAKSRAARGNPTPRMFDTGKGIYG